jgi:hypothetical protein
VKIKVNYEQEALNVSMATLTDGERVMTVRYEPGSGRRRSKPFRVYEGNERRPRVSFDILYDAVEQGRRALSKGWTLR